MYVNFIHMKIINMNVKRIFADNLHYYRKLRKLSQEELAERLEISPKHLSTLETAKGFASAELIERIAHLLGVSVSALFYTPEDKSLDDSDLSRIDKILDETLNSTHITIKSRIRQSKSDK